LFRAKVNRVFSFLSRLQWKLTLSYTVVTVAVITLLLIATIFISGWMTFGLPQVTLLLSQALSSSSTKLAPALSQTPPDTQAVRRWIETSIQGSTIIFNNESDEEVTMSYSTVASSDAILAVLDANGQVIDSNQPKRLTPGQPVPVEISPALQGLIQRVIEGETAPSRLLAHVGPQQMVVSPVRSSDDRLVGITFVLYGRPEISQLIWISVVSIFPAILVLSVAAAIIGSLFGAITARGLSKRLKAATRATAAWGRGDFGVRISDQGPDEIGELSRELNRMAGELQELMQTRQDLAAFEERNHLARELHDSAKQQVFATSMNLAAAKALWERNPEEARKRVDIAAELSRQSQQELTSLIQTLRPQKVDHKSLQLTLCEAAKAWERQYGISVICKIQGNEDRLPSDTEQALYRVAQEALSNVARHSGASRVELSLSHNHQIVIMNIKDNGHGFDITQPVRGLGLRSMQERINSLGGSLIIESLPTGTTLEARVPITRSAIP